MPAQKRLPLTFMRCCVINSMPLRHGLPSSTASDRAKTINIQARYNVSTAFKSLSSLGVVPGTIEHRFHGRKSDRKYIDRWEIFVRHGFDQSIDTVRNEHGVLEWSGNNPRLEDANSP